MSILIGIIIIIGIGFYFRAEIAGFATSEPVVEEPELDIHYILLNSSMVPVKVEGEDRWIIHQRYKIGENGECIKDCALFSTTNNLSFYKAYVQKWGTCMCKYTIPN